MIVLFVSLAVLGLSTVDPVGIGILLLLLAQERPYKRAFTFLGGSFASLMLMGLLFARGLGNVVLHLEERAHWLLPTVEVISACILLVVALSTYYKLRTARLSVEPPDQIAKWLNRTEWHLFLLGAVVVAVQSVIDVVFVMAMIHIGQATLSNALLVAAILTYTVSALALQIAVVVTFRFAPAKKKAQTLRAVHLLLQNYASQVLISVSLVLSMVLFTLAAMS